MLAGKSVRRWIKGLAWGVASAVFGAWGISRHVLGGRYSVSSLAQVRSILAIRLDLMGDVVFTLPAIKALRDASPGSRVTVLSLPYTADIVRGLHFVDRAIAADVNRWRRPGEWLNGAALRQLRALLAQLRAEPYDLCVVFYGRVGAAFALVSGARYLVGYRHEGYLSTFDLAVSGRRYESRQHEAEYCLDLVRALGVEAASVTAAPTVDPVAAERVDLLLAQSGVGPEEKLVALHPGALNMAAKRWLPERWASVADRLQAEEGCRVVLVGSASELPLVEKVRAAMSAPSTVLAGKTSVAELVALLARCDLFLGGDSGPLHVASSLEIPSVAVYGPTDPALTGPLGSHARVLRGSVDCTPCYDLHGAPECRRGDLRCMLQVSAEQVFVAARGMLAEGKERRETATRNGRGW